MNYLKKIPISKAAQRHAEHLADKPILEISGLAVQFDSAVALKDIDFSLDVGEKVAVVGPNGAGKTTLFRVIAGVLRPSRGEVRVYGYTPGGHICIAYVPQRSQVDWRFPVSVADVVMMGRIGKMDPLRWPKASDWENVHQSLELVGLSELSKRQISELSGGQQQRMFIARALAQEAELMLMDEPFTGLDAASQDDILEIMNLLHERNVTILASTHDLNLAADHFNQIMLLNHSIIGFGDPKDVLTPERLIQAYSGQLRLVQTEDELYALSDTCCDEEGIHEHAD